MATFGIIPSKEDNVIELVKQDLRAIKKKNPDSDGRSKINSKEEQKLILGRSPDFGDTFMMREYFSLIYASGDRMTGRRN